MLKTEADAWREVARRIAESEWGKWGGTDINLVLLDMEGDGRLSRCRAVLMHSRLYDYCYGEEEEAAGIPVYFPPSCDTARVLVCLWLALDAETEDNA